MEAVSSSKLVRARYISGADEAAEIIRIAGSQTGAVE